MPIGGAAVGKALSGFTNDKVKQRYFNKPLAGLYTGEYLDALKGLGGRGQTAVSGYEAALKAATPAAKAINTEDTANLGTLIQRGVASDPYEGFGRLLDIQLGPLGKWATALEDRGMAKENARLAALGYGGRGRSGENDRISTNTVSRNIAPVINTIYGNLGANAAIAERNRLGNLASVLGLSSARAALPDALAERELLPYMAATDVLGSQLSLADILGAATRANTAGFEVKKDPWGNFFEQMGTAVDQGADAYMAYKTGGLMGGGSGGGGLLGGVSGGGSGGSSMADLAAVIAMLQGSGSGGFGRDSGLSYYGIGTPDGWNRLSPFERDMYRRSVEEGRRAGWGMNFE